MSGVNVYLDKRTNRWRCYFTGPDGRKRVLSLRLDGSRPRSEAVRRAEAKEREVLESLYRPETAKPAAPRKRYRLTQALEDLLDSKEALRPDEETGGKAPRGSSEGNVRFLRVKGANIVAGLGNPDVNAVTKARVRKYMEERVAEGRSLLTVRHEVRVLVQLLRYAEDEGHYTGENPKKLFPAEIKSQGDVYEPGEHWLTPPQQTAVFEALEETYRPHFMLALETGARAEELFALRPEHVDKKGRKLRIPGTKTRKSNRLVPLSRTALRYVEKLPLEGKYDDFYRALKRATDGVAFVEEVDSETGEVVERYVPHTTCNDLRRTFASSCANAGIPEFKAVRWLGHGSSTMVRTVYQQLAEPYGEELDAVEAWKAQQHRLHAKRNGRGLEPAPEPVEAPQGG